MTDRSGVIALMGSGELTATMVEVHKALLAGLSGTPKAVFIDTPAGFQMNVDEISEKAAAYFRDRVKHPLSIASYKSDTATSEYDAQKAFHTLRRADFILMGPGSPTYAARQFEKTPIPRIITERINAGACLVAASAAALTVGRLTLPVYEMYKVGEAPHWVAGLDILGSFGFNLVVIPHWNNAEGGTHDTRFCFIGASRFRQLEEMLPEGASVLGIDEHTACIMDLGSEMFEIRGIGTVTLRHAGGERIFTAGSKYPLSILKGEQSTTAHAPSAKEHRPNDLSAGKERQPLRERAETVKAAFRNAMDNNRPGKAADALLDLERAIWIAEDKGEDKKSINRARDLLRDMIVEMGMCLENRPAKEVSCMAPLVENLLTLRQQFRDNQQWTESDAVRDILLQSGIQVEDTEAGYQWRRIND